MLIFNSITARGLEHFAICLKLQMKLQFLPKVEQYGANWVMLMRRNGSSQNPLPGAGGGLQQQEGERMVRSRECKPCWSRARLHIPGTGRNLSASKRAPLQHQRAQGCLSLEQPLGTPGKIQILGSGSVLDGRDTSGGLAGGSLLLLGMFSLTNPARTKGATQSLRLGFDPGSGHGQKWVQVAPEWILGKFLQ